MLALVAAVALSLGSALACGGEDEPTAQGAAHEASTSSTEKPATTSSSSPAPTTTSTSTTTAPPSTTTTTTPAPPPAPPPESASLHQGSSGPEVAALQQHLEELHYWVGERDGHFGVLTQQAVFAFQKVNKLPVDGVVGPSTKAKLDAPAAPAPQSRSGVVWEVDKTIQILMVVRDGQVVWVWNTSTGTEKPYVHEGVQHLADTPVGHMTFTREIDGWRNAPLGMIYRPKYFHPDGIAIHGYSSVPPHPASHGCVRVTNPAMDAIWSSGLAPVGTPIWIYGRYPGT